MAGSVDPRTTIVDALLVGRATHSPAAGVTYLEAHSFGVTISPGMNRHVLVKTNTAGNITLDTYDSGAARGNINLNAGTTVAAVFGANPLVAGSSRFHVYNAETADYMIECNGKGTLELNEHITYTEDGDELWTHLTDTTERVIYLRPGVTYDLPAGSGTRILTAARKTVIGTASPRSAAMPIIRLTGNDYLYVQEQCVFENVKFTENWDGPTYPQYLLRCTSDGASSAFRGCIFQVTNSPTQYILMFGTSGRSHIVENCYWQDIPSTAGLICMRSYPAQNSVVRDCTFEGGEKGLYLTGSGWENALVEHNSFTAGFTASGVRLHSTASGENFNIRNNLFIKGSGEAPAPVLHCTGAGDHFIEGNHFETQHADAATWGSVYLVQFENGDIHFSNNQVKGQEMNATVSGLVGVGPNVQSFSCIGNRFIGGVDLTKVLVFDTLGNDKLPANIQVNSNKFEGLLAAADTYIKLQDSTAGVNNYPTLGTISDNIFTGPNGVSIRAVDCGAGAGKEATGFTITGNVMNETVQIYQTPFRTSIFQNNINTSGNDAITPSIAAGDNIVDGNLTYVVDGDTLWSMLSDSVKRRIYLRPDVVYDLPAASGTLSVTTEKTVICDVASENTEKATIRLNGNDLLQLGAKCRFEGIRFTDNWDGPTYPFYLVSVTAGSTNNIGCEFIDCHFAANNAPQGSMIAFGKGVEQSSFYQCFFENIPNDTGRYGINCEGANQVVIRNCRFLGGATAVRVGGNGRGVHIEGNQFESTSGSGKMLDLSAGSYNGIFVRDNRFVKDVGASPGPVATFSGTTTRAVVNNHFETLHSTGWGANYLVEITGGDTVFDGNSLAGSNMTDVGSGLLLIKGFIRSCSVQSCTFLTNVLYTLTIDNNAQPGKPAGLRIVGNVFRNNTQNGAKYIRFIDTAAGAQPWPELGTISHNVFYGYAGSTMEAVSGSPPGGQECKGFTLIGNTMSEDTTIRQDPFLTSIFQNNINVDGSTLAVTSSTPTGDNIVSENLPTPP